MDDTVNMNETIDMEETNSVGSVTDERGSRSTPGFRHHTLRFTYPAFELLPRGKQPIVEKPRGVADREEPELSTLGLSPDDLDFFVRLETNNFYYSVTGDDSLELQGQILVAPQPLNLAAAIDRLAAFGGLSDLRFVSYVDDWDVITRFELSTTFYTKSGKLEQPIQEFEFDSADISKMIRILGQSEEWVRQLDDLFHAKSDRAYLYRYNTILVWDEDWLHEDEERWCTEWDVNPLLGARQLFTNRLRTVVEYDDGSIETKPLGDLEDLEDRGKYVQMPCGHRFPMPPNYIQEMSPREAIYATCDDCDERVLAKKDRQMLSYYYDRIRRYKWEDQTIEWISKGKKFRNDSTLVEISGSSLCASLSSALGTFSLPESINPKALCPTRYPETEDLLDDLVEKIGLNSSIPGMTPVALFNNLEKLAWQLLAEIVGDAAVLAVALPPGFDDFVTRWMTRAVNNAVSTQADDEEDDDLMNVMEKMTRTKLDPKAAAVEDDLDDILKQIGETSLRTASDDAEGDEREGAKDADAEDELL